MPRDLSCREFHPAPRQRVSLVLKVTGPSPHARCLQSKLPPTQPLPLLSCRPPDRAGAVARGPASGESPRPLWAGSWKGRGWGHASRRPRARPGVGTGGTVSPRRASAPAARPGAFTPVHRIPAACFPQSSRCVATGSLSLRADQSPRGVQDSRRSTCTHTRSFLLSFLFSFNFIPVKLP